jgi:hypothetical protein
VEPRPGQRREGAHPRRERPRRIPEVGTEADVRSDASQVVPPSFSTLGR